jgi:hypothetical protein
VKILSEVAALCIAEVKRRKTPKQLLIHVEAAYAFMRSPTVPAANEHSAAAIAGTRAATEDSECEL